MRAIGFTKYGGPEVLEVIERVSPEVGQDQVLVAVHAATVNPTDLLMRSGQQAAWMKDLVPPYIPGMEFAGRIAALGESVTGLEVGQPVMGLVNPRRPEGGALSSEVILSAGAVIPLDESIDLVEAATIPMNGLTALKALEALNLEPGQTLLVTGAAGAVGGYVIELASHFGLHVVADSKDEDRSIVAALGADTIVPRGEGMAEAVRELFPEGVDGAIDAAILGQGAWDAVADHGACVALRGKPPHPDTRIRHLPVSVTNSVEDAVGIARLGQLAAARVLTPRIAKILPLEEAAEGHHLVAAGGLRGRIVLSVSAQAPAQG